MSDQAADSLYKLQSLMAAAIMLPLSKDRMQENLPDGSSVKEHAAKFIKPNKRLTGFERLEIYNKQYWYRLLESLQDDFPGLNALLGHRRFEKLCTAYLNRYPSRSYSLNNLGEKLPSFIKEEGDLTVPDSDVAYDVACLEWAEIRAVDESAKPVLKAEALGQQSSPDISLQTQPYLSILELKYAADTFLLAMNKSHNKSVESNTITQRTVRFSKSSYVKKRRIYVAVHRFNNVLYFKRLDKDQYLLLKALMENKTLAEACKTLISQKDNIQDQQKLARKIHKSFATWMELGWFTN